MGEEAAARIGAGRRSPFAGRRCARFNEYLYDELGFSGNRDHYDDPRNSFLNEVLDRRTGIPITLAVVYLEVARRAGLRVDGVNFPGHFLVRAPLAAPTRGDRRRPDRRSVPRRRAAVRDRLPRAPAAARRRRRGLRPRRCSRRPRGTQIVVRMLVNLKRLYVHMRSFPQARVISEPAAGRRPVGDRRAARPRPARLPPARLRRRAARPRGLPAPAPQAARRAPTTPIRSASDSDDDADGTTRASTSRSGNTSRRCGSGSPASTEAI